MDCPLKPFFEMEIFNLRSEMGAELKLGIAAWRLKVKPGLFPVILKEETKQLWSRESERFFLAHFSLSLFDQQ